MSPAVPPEIDQYAKDHTSPEPGRLLALAEETQGSTAAPQMMVGHLEGRFLKLLVQLARARRVLEIGTFTGYSALSMAEGLPPDGRIVTCEIDERHAEIARRHIAASPYADRIEVRLGPAIETLATLDGPFDLVFVDADKTGYAAYLDAVLPKLADGGLIAVDNVLWSGKVLAPSADDPDTAALRAFNDRVRDDPALEVVMLTVRDGISLIRRRL